MHKLADANAENDGAVCDLMGDLILQAEGLPAHQIDPTDAAILVERATLILGLLCAP
jgi:hypothetical protein